MAIEATCGLCGAPSQVNPCPECRSGAYDQDRTPKKATTSKPPEDAPASTADDKAA